MYSHTAQPRPMTAARNTTKATSATASSLSPPGVFGGIRAHRARCTSLRRGSYLTLTSNIASALYPSGSDFRGSSNPRVEWLWDARRPRPLGIRPMNRSEETWTVRIQECARPAPPTTKSTDRLVNDGPSTGSSGGRPAAGLIASAVAGSGGQRRGAIFEVEWNLGLLFSPARFRRAPSRARHPHSKARIARNRQPRSYWYET